MKKSRAMAFVLISVPLVSAALTAGTRYAWDNWTGVPMLDCPRHLDLGEQKRGDVVIGRFQIKNLGTDVLQVGNFQTSCSCAGVEQEIDGKLFRLKSLSLAPGQAVPLVVRLGIGVRPGESQHVQVLFASNDPNHPHWLIDVLVSRVTGGFFPDPSAAIFGPLSLGQESTRIIDLYDNGTPGRKVEKIHTAHPERFTAALLPLSDKDKQRVHPTAGKLFARIELTPRTERPGPIDGELQVSVANETYIERIPVIGEIVGAAECRPAALVLPRRVQGRFVRSGQVLIWNRHEKPIEVAVDFAPPDIIANVRAVAGHPNQRLLQLEWRPAEKPNGQPLSQERIRLRIHCDGQDSNLELPIILSENRS
jgi:hypothetical protein